MKNTRRSRTLLGSNAGLTASTEEQHALGSGALTCFELGSSSPSRYENPLGCRGRFPADIAMKNDAWTGDQRLFMQLKRHVK
jgi:hypothetical protein